MLDIKINALTAEAFLALYTSVGWEPPCEAQVRTALQNSLATFTAFEEGTPVGMARLIGDGGMSFYIKDFAILPSHQGKGIGTGSFVRWKGTYAIPLPPAGRSAWN